MPKPQPSQQFVPIKEIRDGIAVMEDGSLKMVLMASSINMSLKSPDEQQSVLVQFQNFLNSLDFSLQIYTQSRRYDVRPYIALLESREREQTNDLAKIQIREYIQFIKTFTEQTNIMTKNFFIVVPYTPSIIETKTGPFSSLFGKTSSATTTKDGDAFSVNRSQLEQRMYIVQQGLVRAGVRTTPLGTEELVELFYRMFNPGEQDKPIKV
ncbi:MAG: hypothetical protein HGB03_03830 [Candidatus Yonathbacteria bacterium]|nr:hypothetical protein [Candidatus Yonathbacteria bacterium]NTW47639.1 hypothetical protein [Candidatus Yonathbacteria bacterium]